MLTHAPVFAVLSAALFGISPTLAKLVIGGMSPILLAALLYLGSGLGLLIVLAAQKQNLIEEIRKLPRPHQMKLLGAIISGGIIAPLFLAYAIQLASAFEVSLLLNLETVATTLIAALVFHEHIGKRVWVGKVMILVGAAVIAASGESKFSIAALLVVGACIFWGIDNNLTREIEDLPPVVLACIKGWGAGIFNLLLAFALGKEAATLSQVGFSLIIGTFSYGMSLVLFIWSLRLIGSSRTSTYFASGPFMGMVFSVLLLGEHPPLQHWLAGVLMLVGIWTLYRESHEHVHSHDPITHRHKHVHDEHHQHIHEGNEGPEPHNHIHTHEPITHAHPHWPDIHHRHQHGSL
jgi:drug/metabolite transporter (DMT)-like permease